MATAGPSGTKPSTSASTSSSAPRPLASIGSSGNRPPPLPAMTTARSTTDPVLRNALRYTISAREYAALHKYVLSRSRILRRATPSVSTVERILDGDRDRKGKGKEEEVVVRSSTRLRGERDERGEMGESSGSHEQGGRGQGVAGQAGANDFNARAVRHSVRVFLATGLAMKAWGLVNTKLLGRKPEYVVPGSYF
jgi:hypothetical protein